MAKITMTRDLAWACAWDAGNRHMRKNGRKKWNREDHFIACQAFNEICPLNPDMLDGTEGQDRESYSDAQDRENYT